MKAEGYKLNGYDATYEKTLFDVKSKANKEICVLEVLDINSGITFVVELKKDIGGDIARFFRKKS